jgi:hypothetical protein
MYFRYTIIYNLSALHIIVCFLIKEPRPVDLGLQI